MRDAAEASLARTVARRDALAARLAPRLWWPPSQVARVLAGPNATVATLAALIERLAACEAGFAALPLDHHAAHAEPPLPVRVA